MPVHRWILILLFATYGTGSSDLPFDDAIEFQAIASQARDGLSHRDVLRSYQTVTRLLGCSNSYRAHEHCMSVYSDALNAALEEWGSSQSPEEVVSTATVMILGAEHVVDFRSAEDFESEAARVCEKSADSSALETCRESVLQQLGIANQRIREAKEAAAPPRQIPAELWHDFTDSGSTPVLDWYRDDSYATYYKLYPRPFLQVMDAMVAQRQPGTNYPFVDRELYALLDAPGSEVAAMLQGAVVGVMGSAVPWYEVLVLHYGAAEAVTIEYNRVSYQDERIRAMTPEEYWGLESRRPRFDIALSISSFEHDGLGRYGDPLNPFGDLEAMAEMEQVLKPGGIMLLAVPVGWEAVVWNCHRIYGRRRLSELLHRWSVHSVHGLYRGIFDKRTFVPDQPLFVLSNTRPEQPMDFTQQDQWP